MGIRLGLHSVLCLHTLISEVSAIAVVREWIPEEVSHLVVSISKS